MLRSAKDLEGYAIGATDGAVGHVDDLLFDDERWTVRYLVVSTGTWLKDRRVLISPMSVGLADRAGKLLPVAITTAQVRGSPDIDTQRPVSRQQEIDYLTYYGYPFYWGGAGLWGGGMFPGAVAPGVGGLGPDAAERSAQDDAYVAALRTRHEKDDPHLRSCKAIVGCHVHASDGDIGHVQGMLVDERSWAVRYLIVDTSNWWMGHQVLIAPLWIDGMDDESAKVDVDLTRDAIRNSHPYDPDRPLTRTDEIHLHEHYGREGYWATSDAASRSIV